MYQSYVTSPTGENECPLTPEMYPEAPFLKKIFSIETELIEVLN